MGQHATARRDQGRAAAERPRTDPLAFDLMDVVDGRVLADDEVDLFVVERQDHPQRRRCSPVFNVQMSISTS